LRVQHQRPTTMFDTPDRLKPVVWADCLTALCETGRSKSRHMYFLLKTLHTFCWVGGVAGTQAYP
jgi:hypothetical protein